MTVTTHATGSPASRIALHAVRSLHAELMLFPKPGLVSATDSGSHDDMDAALFMRSLFSLRGFFKAAAQGGMARTDFASLNLLGQAAERRMLQATAGINTHRGAIFCLGLLCAAAGSVVGTVGRPTTAAALQSALQLHWGDALRLHCGRRLPDAHGTRAAALHGAGGARAQAAAGMPAVFDLALPALRTTLAAGRGWECARIDAFFHLLAHLDDSNVLHRGGAAGARLVRDCGMTFLRRGGTADPRWRATALASHQLLVAHQLSPGGAADLLAATCLVQALIADNCIGSGLGSDLECDVGGAGINIDIGVGNSIGNGVGNGVGVFGVSVPMPTQRLQAHPDRSCVPAPGWPAAVIPAPACT